MVTRELSGERITVLPKRVETGFISIGNQNWAFVTQGNASLQLQGVGIASPQVAAQTNNALVIQHN